MNILSLFGLQLQTLIHLLFEHLSSLLESLSTVGGRGKPQEVLRETLANFIPSLRKLRKLAGVFSRHILDLTFEVVDYLNLLATFTLFSMHFH